MKVKGISEQGWRRLAQFSPLNLLKDPDRVLDVLTQIEGSAWMQRSVNDMSEYSWGGILRGLAEAQEEVKLYRDEMPLEEFKEVLRDAYVWVLYGDGGYARYRITGDGDIALDAGSTRQPQVEKAQSLGMNLY